MDRSHAVGCTRPVGPRQGERGACWQFQLPVRDTTTRGGCALRRGIITLRYVREGATGTAQRTLFMALGGSRMERQGTPLVYATVCTIEPPR